MGTQLQHTISIPRLSVKGVVGNGYQTFPTQRLAPIPNVGLHTGIRKGGNQKMKWANPSIDSVRCQITLNNIEDIANEHYFFRLREEIDKSLVGKTMDDVCKFIIEADILRKPDGQPPTSEEIFNYSPTGELFRVFQWYDDAYIKQNVYPYLKAKEEANVVSQQTL